MNRFLTRKTWQEPPSLFWTICLGFALLMLSMGLLHLLAGYVATFVQLLFAALIVAGVSEYGSKLWAIRTRSGLWEKSIVLVISDLVSEVYADEPGGDQEYLDRARTLLVLLAGAPTYIGEDSRSAYWSDTLAELRQHTASTRVLLEVTKKRNAAQQRLAAVQSDTPAPKKRWGIFLVPTPPEDPLLRTARAQLAEVDLLHHDLTSYLERIATNVAVRQRELQRAIAVTELYLAVQLEGLVLPPLPNVEPLLHLEVVRSLVS